MRKQFSLLLCTQVNECQVSTSSNSSPLSPCYYISFSDILHDLMTLMSHTFPVSLRCVDQPRQLNACIESDSQISDHLANHSTLTNHTTTTIFTMFFTECRGHGISHLFVFFGKLFDLGLSPLVTRSFALFAVIVIQKTQFSRSKLIEDDPRTLLCRTRVTRSCCTIESSIVNAILKWKCVGNEAQCDPNLHNESASHRFRSCCAKAVHAHHLWCSGNVSYLL